MARAPEALTGVDFLDFGSSSGSNLEWGSKTFGGAGMGVASSEKQAQLVRQAGHRALVGDVRELALPDKSVKYSLIMDLLPRLQTVEDAAMVVKTADRISREFFVVTLPNFDNERILKERGLKRYYADWSSHSLHLRTSQLLDALIDLRRDTTLYRYGEIFDTWDRNVIPASAPRNSSFFDPSKFEERRFEVLPRKILFTKTIAIVVKSGTLKSPALLTKCLETLGIVRELVPK
jgi:hypothetical protein